MTEFGVRTVLEDKRFLLCITVAAAALAFLGPLVDFDLWWHVKAGGLILATGSVPRTDPFSFTAAGQPWVYHSWLSAVLLNLMWRAGGPMALVLYRALVLAGVLMLAWAAARKRGVGPAVASILALAGCLQFKLRALERPFLFSLLLFIVFAMILQACISSPPPEEQAVRLPGTKRRQWLAAEDSVLWGPGGRLILLPVLTVLWANLHAGFISGLLLISAYGAGEMVRLAAHTGVQRCPAMLLKGLGGARFRAMFITGVLCVAASVITPYGPGILLYPFWLSHTVKLMKKVVEWQPMPMRLDFAVFWVLMGFGALIFVRSIYFTAKAGRLRAQAGQYATDILLMAGFGFLAIQSVRHMEWVLLLVPSILGWHLQAYARFSPEEGADGELGQRRPYAYVALVLALAVGVWPLVNEGIPRPGVGRGTFPVEACDYMAARKLDYRFYNTYEWGGYLIWRFWPEKRVFIDGRCEVYRDKIMGQAIDVEAGKANWERILDRWDVQMFIVRYRKRDSSHFFAGDRWRCVYWDDAAIIGLRSDAFVGRRPGLPEFALSNPITIEKTLGSAAPEKILKEVDLVLARDPECWTAWAYRARSLVRMAAQKPDERRALLRDAFRAAQQAVGLQDKHYETWLAMEEVAEALGDKKAVAEAAAQVEKWRPPPYEAAK